MFIPQQFELDKLDELCTKLKPTDNISIKNPEIFCVVAVLFYSEDWDDAIKYIRNKLCLEEPNKERNIHEQHKEGCYNISILGRKGGNYISKLGKQFKEHYGKPSYEMSYRFKQDKKYHDEHGCWPWEYQ